MKGFPSSVAFRKLSQSPRCVKRGMGGVFGAHNKLQHGAHNFLKSVNRKKGTRKKTAYRTVGTYATIVEKHFFLRKINFEKTLKCNTNSIPTMLDKMCYVAVPLQPQEAEQQPHHSNTRQGESKAAAWFAGQQRVERRTDGAEWPRSCLGVAWLWGLDRSSSGTRDAFSKQLISNRSTRVSLPHARLKAHSKS